jgi:hypothetical protein
MNLIINVLAKSEQVQKTQGQEWQSDVEQRKLLEFHGSLSERGETGRQARQEHLCDVGCM